MPIADWSLRIQESQTVDAIEAYLRDLLEKRSAGGVLIGLSGGVDSAVLTTMAVRALGKERVHVYHLYDRDSERESEHNARRVADSLGLELVVESIEPVMRQKGIYSSPFMRLAIVSRRMNRWLLDLYRSLCGETPFISTLRRDRFGGHRVRKLIYDLTIRPVEAAFNARHLYRREMLEGKAQKENWLLLGAANRSECMVGWFVKDGIDDVPLSPLMGLYKTQVQQLAAYLGIPPEVRDQVASPDMMRGVTDEFALGIRYATVDIILDGVDRGCSDEELIAAGAAEGEISLVRELHQHSAWKRESEHEDPPVDGTVRGTVRAC